MVKTNAETAAGLLAHLEAVDLEEYTKGREVGRSGSEPTARRSALSWS
jgi:hypothetical protein